MSPERREPEPLNQSEVDEILNGAQPTAAELSRTLATPSITP
jgi:hypothetical protein